MIKASELENAIELLKLYYGKDRDIEIRSEQTRVNGKVIIIGGHTIIDNCGVTFTDSFNHMQERENDENKRDVDRLISKVTVEAKDSPWIDCETQISAKEKHHTRMAFLGMVLSITNLILLLQILLFKA